MSLRHLTDEQIQEYLEGSSSYENKDIKQHLRICEKCRGLLLQYQFLFGELGKETINILSSDFTQKTLSRIPDTVKDNERLITFLISIPGIAAALVLLIGFIDWKPFLDGFNFTMTSFLKLAAALNGSFLVLVFAVMVLLLLAFVDQIIAPVKNRIIS